MELLYMQEFIESIESLPKAGIQDLFSRSYIRPVIIGVGLMVLQQFVGINGILFYASETFVSAGNLSKIPYYSFLFVDSRTMNLSC
jgi:SP family facilitated glucose transporter-like MFS transporter 8